MRRGRLKLGRAALVASLLSDLDLDLRSAELTSHRSTLAMGALCGNIDLYVPDDLDVSVNGPSIDVWDFSLFGTVDVWRIPRTMKGDYGKLIKKLRRAQRQLEH